MEYTNKIGTIKVYDDCGTLNINPHIYPLDVIYSAAYIMIDKAYIVLDGNPNTEIIVEIRKKNENQDVKNLIEEFNDELLNYLVHKSQGSQNARVKEILLQRALLTNSSEQAVKEDNVVLKTIKKKMFTDTKGIMKVWEEVRTNKK
ncbi:His-Xaa-Ser system protein HxsD [Candidatus Woesearchaeota archaeon]|nr:His-Xaa-Ser system protein HxsD [Candidatus Woesearchaeota archaeon]